MGKQAIIKFMFKKGTRLRMLLHGIGRHWDEEIKDFVCEDLTTISQLLREQKVHFWCEVMATRDCSLFGHLAQFHYVRLPEYQEFMRNSVPTWWIMSKTLKELWSNWDEQWKPESMKNLIM